MSSEQANDCSYAQFVQDQLPDFNLFGGASMTFNDGIYPPTEGNSGPSYFDDAFVLGNDQTIYSTDQFGTHFETGDFDAQHLSAFSLVGPMDLEVPYYGPGPFAFQGEQASNESNIFDNAANQQMMNSETAEFSQESVVDMSGTDADMVDRGGVAAHPTSVSFFFRSTLTRRAVGGVDAGVH